MQFTTAPGQTVAVRAAGRRVSCAPYSLASTAASALATQAGCPSLPIPLTYAGLVHAQKYVVEGGPLSTHELPCATAQSAVAAALHVEQLFPEATRPALHV
jgi:hypothetical protein